MFPYFSELVEGNVSTNLLVDGSTVTLLPRAETGLIVSSEDHVTYSCHLERRFVVCIIVGTRFFILFFIQGIKCKWCSPQHTAMQFQKLNLDFILIPLWLHLRKCVDPTINFQNKCHMQIFLNLAESLNKNCFMICFSGISWKMCCQCKTALLCSPRTMESCPWWYIALLMQTL